ncbi:hypothetical protein K0M31_013942 [Melipona bicolor]|uniref:Uncharacterized protein n=1 Tax=Melipona bicolor TaxID=60889 RepID=A0AA40G7K5_9HYME|nr:hypothetical protein K0M31_013942 [Melipona bicolor]
MLMKRLNHPIPLAEATIPRIRLHFRLCKFAVCKSLFTNGYATVNLVIMNNASTKRKPHSQTGVKMIPTRNFTADIAKLLDHLSTRAAEHELSRYPLPAKEKKLEETRTKNAQLRRRERR